MSGRRLTFLALGLLGIRRLLPPCQSLRSPRKNELNSALSSASEGIYVDREEFWRFSRGRRDPIRRRKS